MEEKYGTYRIDTRYNIFQKEGKRLNGELYDRTIWKIRL